MAEQTRTSRALSRTHELQDVSMHNAQAARDGYLHPARAERLSLYSAAWTLSQSAAAESRRAFVVQLHPKRRHIARHRSQ